MINLNGIKVKNRYFIAAGPAKYGRGYAIYENPLNFFLFRFGFIRPEEFGAVVTKTLTLSKRRGNYRWWKPWRVLRRIPGGWINRFGWNNCGMKKFMRSKYPQLKLDNLIVSIGSLGSVREILAMVDTLNGIDVAAVEIDVFCPHLDTRSRFSQEELKLMFRRAARLSRHPLIAKLAPGNLMIPCAKIAEESGFNAVCAINTLRNVSRPDFGVCGASGKIIKPLALESVRSLSGEINIPVIGGGGIYTRKDCEDFFAAGAKAVFFSSVFLDDPLRPGRIVRGCDVKRTARPEI